MNPRFVTPQVWDRVQRLELPFNRHGLDPYGISQKDLGRWMSGLEWLYRHYFRVHVSGLEHVPSHGRGMLVGNHSGGVALDAAIVTTTIFLEKEPPRLAQGMADKFINTLPFASQWAARTGQFTGLPEHARRLLLDDRLLLVFPEGHKGTAKLYPERHSLVGFGDGFVRLALSTRSPIIPFAFLGGGEAIPTVWNSEFLGKLTGTPYVPLTPYLLPIPRPVDLDIVFDTPIVLAGDGHEDDEVIRGHVEAIKSRIAGLIARGRQERRDRAPWRLG